MGLYDRDYERERNYYDDRPGFRLDGPLSMTTKLVIVMCAIYLVQLFTASSDWFTDTFALHADFLRRPWQFYQLLTYGFLHDPNLLAHILSNMIGLWFFGRVVEDRYGRREFLIFFLTAIVVAGLVWFVSELLAHGTMTSVKLLGASGGVSAVLILFALNFPHHTVMFMMLFPMKAWVLAVLLLVYDVYGAITRTDTVAFTAHLGGAAFAFLYFRYRWRLESWAPSGDLLKGLKPRPKLRVHDPDDVDAGADTKRMDDILKKIHEHGEASLTRSERRFMQKASREYQKKRGG